MVAIPLGKMFILAVKQVAKPMAKGIKNVAVNSSFVKNYVVMPIGQGMLFDRTLALKFFISSSYTAVFLSITFLT